MSVPAISSGFKRLTGENYLTYLHGIRIKNACSLLRTAHTLSVMDIALEVGYNSYETFARVFRRQMGVTAMGYRKKSVSEIGAD